LIQLYRPCSAVALALVDQSSGVRGNWVIDKNIHVVFCGKKRTDVALQRKVRAVSKLDLLDNLWLGSVYQMADIRAQLALPIW